MAHSFDHSCNGKASERSVCFVKLHVVFNNIIISVAQKYFFDKFILPGAIKHAQSSCKVPDILVGFSPILEYFDRFS